MLRRRRAPGDADEAVRLDDAVDRDGGLADADDPVGARKMRGCPVEVERDARDR